MFNFHTQWQIQTFHLGGGGGMKWDWMPWELSVDLEGKNVGRQAPGTPLDLPLIHVNHLAHL